MVQYIARRLLMAIPTLIAICLITFLIHACNTREPTLTNGTTGESLTTGRSASTGEEIRA